MPSPNRLPTSIRYIKARLRILQRPMVWGSASALLLSILVFHQYWQHPEWFTSDNTPSTAGVASLEDLPDPTQYQTLPSQEDSAIGADIDSLPLLLSDFNLPPSPELDQENSSSPPSSSRPQSQPSPNGLASLDTSRVVSSSQINLLDPFSSASSSASRSSPYEAWLPNRRAGEGAATTSQELQTLPNPIAAVPGQPGKAPGMLFGVNLMSLSTPTTAAPQANPLEVALQQYSGPATRRQPSVQTNSPFTSLPNSPSSTVATPQQQSSLRNPIVYQTSPLPGSTGYTLPQTLRPAPLSAPGYGSSPYQVPSSAGAVNSTYPASPQVPSAAVTAPYGGFQRGGTYGIPTYQAPATLVQPYNRGTSYTAPAANPVNGGPQFAPLQPEPAPFTAPYSRGGGEFNTFSNP